VAYIKYTTPSSILCKSSSFKIDSLLYALWTLFHNTPARREDFKRLTGGDKFPLKFCSHRWTENVDVVRRALEIWPCMEKFVEHMQKPEHEKAQPQTASFKIVAKAVRKRSFKRCQLKFVYSIAVQLQPFVKRFQSDAPLVPFLAEDFAKLLHSVVARFINHSCLPSSQAWGALMQVDVENS
jgi:hypothetical protein